MVGNGSNHYNSLLLRQLKKTNNFKNFLPLKDNIETIIKESLFVFLNVQW